MAIKMFKKEHLDSLDMTDDTRKAVSMPVSFRTLRYLATKGLCKTICLDDGTVLGVMAGVPFDNGACEVFIVPCENQKRNPVVFARSVRKELQALKRRFDRIQVLTGWNMVAVRFIIWLGFHYERAIMRPEFNGSTRMQWRLI